MRSRTRWGATPKAALPVLADRGRFGPWLRRETIHAAPGDDDDVVTVVLNHAVHLQEEQAIRLSRSRGSEKMQRALVMHPDGASVWLKTGRHGPVVARRPRCAALPKVKATDDVTPEAAPTAALGGIAGPRWAARPDGVS